MDVNSASKHFKTIAFSPTYFKLLGFLFFHTDSVSVPVIIPIGSMEYSSSNISFVRNPLRNGWAMPASAAKSFNAAMPNGLTLAKVFEEPQPKILFGSSLRSGDKHTLGVQPTKQSGWSLGWSMWRIPYYQWARFGRLGLPGHTFNFKTHFLKKQQTKQHAFKSPHIDHWRILKSYTEWIQLFTS